MGLFKTKEEKQKKIQEEYEELAKDCVESKEKLEKALEDLPPEEREHFGKHPSEIKYEKQLTDFYAMLECHPILKMIYPFWYVIVVIIIISVLLFIGLNFS